jgi:glycosyltransferase involved in cell wall biosynthesis/SAM-dependent methyltransferase
MINNENLVVFGPDYNRYPSVSQHVCDQLLDTNRITWVEVVGMRIPELTLHDIKRIAEKIRNSIITRPKARRGALHPNLTVLTPFTLPYTNFKWVRKFNLWQVRRALKKLNLQNKVTDFTLIATVPSNCDYVGNLGEARSIYYCIDEFSLWPGMSPSLVRSMENEILEKADQVIVSADALLKTKSNGKYATELLTHGVNRDHFATMQQHRDVKSKNSFEMLYFGLFDARSDQKLLARLAQEVPNVQIKVIGDVVTDITLFEKINNVHFLGKVAYSDLPKAIAQTDVFILPYICDDLGKNINPIKLKEYMATGQPVISTALPEVVKFEDYVKVARSHDEFVKFAQDYQAGRSIYNSEKSWKRLDSESWLAKAEQFSDYISKLLERKPKTQTEAQSVPLKYYPYPLATVTPRDLLLLDRLPGNGKKSALEIGTGSATSMFRLGPHFKTLDGADISPEIIEWTSSELQKNADLKNRCDVFTANLCAQDAWKNFPRKYDLIYSCDMFEYASDPGEFFKNLYGGLEPGGKIFITFPNERAEDGHGVNSFEHREDLQSIVEKAGFTQISVNSIFINNTADTLLHWFWDVPRKVFHKLRNPRRKTHIDASPTFSGTEFYKVKDRLGAFTPIVNFYCWSVMRLMQFTGRVYLQKDATKNIIGQQILIEACRP